MVWNDKLKREIPLNWDNHKLLNVVSWNGGSQPPKSEHISVYKDGYVRFIQNRDYAGSNHITYIPNSSTNKLCTPFDIMMDKYGDAGKTRYGISGAFNVALSRIDVKLPYMQEYIRSYLSSSSVKQYLSGACIASTRASLNEDNLSFLNVIIPPDNILKLYDKIAKNIIKNSIDLNQETLELINLRDWLLPMLMNGQATIE